MLISLEPRLRDRRAIGIVDLKIPQKKSWDSWRRGDSSRLFGIIISIRTDSLLAPRLLRGLHPLRKDCHGYLTQIGTNNSSVHTLSPIGTWFLRSRDDGIQLFPAVWDHQVPRVSYPCTACSTRYLCRAFLRVNW